MIPEINTTFFNPQENKKPDGIMDKDDFLKLLVMQMQYQDPFSPMKGTEFAAQLAHFSSVEQLSNINTNLLVGLDANFMLAQSINNALATTFIGKEVKASADKFQYTGDGDVTLGYNLPSSASEITVKIYDSSGELVRTLNGDTTKGDHTLVWDGKDVNGQSVEEGKYSFVVEAKDSSGTKLKTDQYIFGTVEGIRFKETGTFFVIGGVEIALSDIWEIMDHSSDDPLEGVIKYAG